MYKIKIKYFIHFLLPKKLSNSRLRIFFSCENVPKDVVLLLFLNMSGLNPVARPVNNAWLCNKKYTAHFPSLLRKFCSPPIYTPTFHLKPVLGV